MSSLPKTTVINERHDYTGATLAICLSILAAGYFGLKHFAGDPSHRESARIESRSKVKAAYELERTRLGQLQDEIIRLKRRYDILDPRMSRLRLELAVELRAKLNVYRVEYEQIYEPLLEKIRNSRY